VLDYIYHDNRYDVLKDIIHYISLKELEMSVNVFLGSTNCYIKCCWLCCVFLVLLVYFNVSLNISIKNENCMTSRINMVLILYKLEPNRQIEQMFNNLNCKFIVMVSIFNGNDLTWNNDSFQEQHSIYCQTHRYDRLLPISRCVCLIRLYHGGSSTNKCFWIWVLTS